MSKTANNQIVNCELKLPRATILIIKQDPCQRLGLSKILSEQESLTIQDCADSFTGLRLAQTYQPDVIILDLEILESSNFELYKQLKVQSAKSKLIVSGKRIDREAILKVYSIAAGYYYENGDLAKLLLAIANTVEGSIYVDPITSDLLSNSLLLPIDSLSWDSLVPKELAAVKYLITGKDYQEIAEFMSVSPHTVRNYICRTVSKLGLENRIQVIVAAVRSGLFAEA